MSAPLPPAQALELVVFDLDGVLCDFDSAARLDHLSRCTGLAPAHIQAATFGGEFERAAEAGRYPSGEEYLAAFRRQLGTWLSREDWVAARRAAMRERPAMLALVARLRRAVPVAILTNNGALLLEAIPELVPGVHALFRERCHASFEFGTRKPEPLVYRRLLARLGTPAGRTLFVDDSPANVAGAVAAGLGGVVFEGPDRLEATLSPLLGGPDLPRPIPPGHH